MAVGAGSQSMELRSWFVKLGVELQAGSTRGVFVVVSPTTELPLGR